MLRRIFLMLAVTGLGACERAESAPAARHTTDASVHVDSIFTIDEEIRRFRDALGNPGAHALSSRAGSRDALIASFADAIGKADTAALRAMTLDAAEFIDLYYPHTIHTKKPYELAPATVWMLHVQASEKGITRLLQRLGGSPPSLTDLRCATEPQQQGPNRIWTDCTVTMSQSGAARRLQLFSAILERDGRFEFVSYANDL